MASTRPYRLAPVLLLALGACWFHTKKDNPWATQILPLARGATWTYKATVTHFDETANKEVKTQLTWKTEVVDVIPGQTGIVGYVVKGWLSDLNGAAGATPVPTERILLKSEDGYMWGKDRSPSLETAQGWFALPLQAGGKVCPDPQLTYCWEVSETDKGYALSYHAGPESERYVLEPGRGVTRYDYSQAGTTDEVTAELQSFTPGSTEPRRTASR